LQYSFQKQFILRPLKNALFKYKSCGFETHSFKKENHGFLFFLSTHGFNKLVLFYLAGPWIDFLKKKPSKKLKKPKYKKRNRIH